MMITRLLLFSNRPLPLRLLYLISWYSSNLAYFYRRFSSPLYFLYLILASLVLSSFPLQTHLYTLIVNIPFNFYFEWFSVHSFNSVQPRTLQTHFYRAHGCSLIILFLVAHFIILFQWWDTQTPTIVLQLQTLINSHIRLVGWGILWKF